MYNVLIFDYVGRYFWLKEDKEFDTFWQALAYATKSGLPFEIYRDFFYISAVKLVSRSRYELWEYWN